MNDSAPLSSTTPENSADQSAAEIAPRDDKRFNADMEDLIRYAEDMRLSAMKAQRNRGFIAMSIGLSLIVLGAAGFGWFLLVKAHVINALGSIALGLVLAVGLHIWSAQTLNEYKRDYKTKFLPKMAQILGGFKYHPARGISLGLLSKTGVLPAHDTYEAEDCFMGRYKGVKVLFSEARLKHKKKYLEPAFNGIFVLLEDPDEKIQGHTIISANKDMIHKWRSTRWKKLKDVDIPLQNPAWDRFTIVSDKPEAAQEMISETLLKELAEAADIFENAPLTAAFFRKKFIFIMIPYDGDMFEASDIYVPVTTKRHALQCKREIEKILEIIDVFDVYRSG